MDGAGAQQWQLWYACLSLSMCMTTAAKVGVLESLGTPSSSKYPVFTCRIAPVSESYRTEQRCTKTPQRPLLKAMMVAADRVMLQLCSCALKAKPHIWAAHLAHGLQLDLELPDAQCQAGF